ncbi:hypothetical protein C0J52_20349 [Blattella germanica]|nr:hypothetical protein C0J52_20349 [Blattella germanica]
MDLKFGIVITLIVGVVSIQTDVNTEVYQRDCKLMFTYGYGYNKYFHISEAGTHKGRELTIRFLVRARSDAHLLLSPVQSPSEIMPVYEIVLGAGKNTFSDIRRLRRSSTRATSATKDLLSPIELRAFWVRLDNKGLIEVGKEGEDAPFLFWTDPTPLDIQYFSFCTWTGVVGKWLYDCPIANDTEKIEVVEEKPTTMTEKLRKDLLSNYDPYALPLLHADHRIIIFMHLIYHHVTLDVKQSIFTIDGTLPMLLMFFPPQHWMDEKIRWNPNDYGGLTDVHIKEHEVWIPEIVLYNSIGHGANILGHSGMTITSEGAVMWSPSATLQVWCNINVSEWPNDEHTCELQLGFWTQREFLELLIVDNQTVMENEEKTRSEWKIVKMEAETLITAKPWIQDVDFDDDSSSPDSLTVRITVRRQSQHYHTLLETPLVVISMLMFLSFWMTPESSNKIGIICICLVLLALLIVTIGTLLPAPADHVPCLKIRMFELPNIMASLEIEDVQKIKEQKVESPCEEKPVSISRSLRKRNTPIPTQQPSKRRCSLRPRKLIMSENTEDTKECFIRKKCRPVNVKTLATIYEEPVVQKDGATVHIGQRKLRKINFNTITKDKIKKRKAKIKKVLTNKCPKKNRLTMEAFLARLNGLMNTSNCNNGEKSIIAALVKCKME